MSEVYSALTWCYQLVKSTRGHRQKAKRLALNAIKHFKKGEASKEGDELAKELKENYEFIGFIPSVSYVKEKGTKKDLQAIWVHPFSTPTLLYKHKKLPVLVVVNGNIDFNDTRIRKIDKNADLDGLENILGITG